MNPHYLWLADAMQLPAFFAVGPVLAIAIACAGWKGKPESFDTRRYAIVCVASGVTAVLLFAFGKWLNADIRSPQYFLQLACVLLSGLLFGVYIGCGFPVLLGIERWHKTTRKGPLRTITSEKSP